MRRANRFAASLERKADALLGREYKLQPPPTEAPPRQRAQVARPRLQPIDIRDGFTRAAAALDPRAVVVLFVDGAAPVAVARTELLAWASDHAPTLAHELVSLEVRAGWIATVRASPTWARGSFVVGALRVIAPHAPKGTTL